MKHPWVLFFLVSSTGVISNSRAEDVAVMENEPTEFRAKTHRCYVCDPALTKSCENLVDCCMEVSDDYVQACEDNVYSCHKTIALRDQFVSVTRGCGKKYAFGPGGTQSDSECVNTPGGVEEEMVCNCAKDKCNSSQRTIATGFLMIVPLIVLLTRRLP